MKHIFRIISCAAAVLLLSCNTDRPADLPSPRIVKVEVGMQLAVTRAFPQFGETPAIDYVMLIPFEKTGITGTDADFIPVPQYATAIPLAQLHDLAIYLPEGFTFHILALGYNSADYDWKTNTGNFTVTPDAALDSFAVTVTSPLSPPPLYMCTCTDSDNSPEFVAGTGERLTGLLAHATGGVSLTLTAVPAFVSSIEVLAVGSFNASMNATATPAGIPAPYTADTGSLGMMTIADGTATLDKRFLPAAGVGFVLRVTDNLGQTATYNVTADGTSSFDMVADTAYNFSGDYLAAIRFGFVDSTSLGLDDDVWDGLQ